jgi:hypothetical protein
MSKKKSTRRSGRTSTTLEQHHRGGSVLTPPLADLSKMPKMQAVSWRDDQLPELLWIALLITHLPREDYITLFRQFAESILIHEPAETRPFDMTFSGLSHLDEHIFDEFIEPLMAFADCQRILSGLMVLDDFPGKQQWKRYLGEGTPEEGWKTLMRAVAHTLDHQSQESTDCRWFRVEVHP